MPLSPADATYYGAGGSGGNCNSAFKYPGFKTVAMNKAQYANGAACGGCIRACMNDNAPWHPGGRKCFSAIVDNQVRSEVGTDLTCVLRVRSPW